MSEAEIIELHGSEAFPVAIRSVKGAAGRKLVLWVDAETLIIPESKVDEFKKYLLDFIETKCPEKNDRI